ncbi:MAG: hypothetical protein H7061_06275 [Bdellovibrionaceae bacterium]|nr:hypothetical protein [Bdellovibrio sp.]
MFKLAFQNFSDSRLIAIGFILFMITFIGALIWTVFVQKKSFYDQLSHLPLSAEDKNEK